MKIGDEATLLIKEKVSDTEYIVINIITDEEAILTVKGKLKISKSNTVNGWVIKYDKKKKYIYGNAYFGKYSISKGIAEEYTRIISTLFSNEEMINDADISKLKGMVNRCLKKDQWDWYTTYEYIGYPTSQLMNQFIEDSVRIRDELRNGNRNSISGFRNSYFFLFNSMMYHLGEKLEDKDDDYSIPIKNFDVTMWNRLSYESKKI